MLGDDEDVDADVCVWLLIDCASEPRACLRHRSIYSSLSGLILLVRNISNEISTDHKIAIGKRLYTLSLHTRARSAYGLILAPLLYCTLSSTLCSVAVAVAD